MMYVFLVEFLKCFDVLFTERWKCGIFLLYNPHFFIPFLAPVCVWEYCVLHGIFLNTGFFPGLKNILETKKKTPEMKEYIYRYLHISTIICFIMSYGIVMPFEIHVMNCFYLSFMLQFEHCIEFIESVY